jgi:LuxR family transcriptional regulator, maltose regulon positive regulatory protein
LIELMNAALSRQLTLISAPAGFGKTTLVSEWIDGCDLRVAWLSLDPADSDRTRFLTYLVAALQRVAPNSGAGLLAALQSPQPPPTESILTSLLNEIAAVSDRIVLVFDDYHVVDAKPVDEALSFLVEHLPPQMHLVLITREDPQLPLARLRARGRLTELRAGDLRFTSSEAAEFLNQVMGLNLSAEDMTALESRTEGWIAGLQLAALSMQGHADASSFIKSFTGSHRFVLDYLMEEVLQQQPETIQDFLLKTSILDRMCGSLCDAVLRSDGASGQATLEHLERANLFIVPLDNERRWYRYHHLFAHLLRQRLQQSFGSASAGVEGGESGLHVRASEWFESQGLELEAFHHAVAANDVERAERIIDGKGAPLYVRGGAVPVLTWLESLPAATLDARPQLWFTFATVLSVMGKMSRVESKLRAAEAAMGSVESDATRSQLSGGIENLREGLGILTADPRQLDAIIARSAGILERPTSESAPVSAAMLWRLGIACLYTGRYLDAREACSKAIAISEATGNVHMNILATSSLGRTFEYDNNLPEAAEAYRQVLQLAGNPPIPTACEALSGLARLYCKWNDLETAWTHGVQSLQLARHLEISSFATSELALARIQLARGDVSEAAESLAGTARSVRQGLYGFRMPEVAGMQVRALIRLGDLPAAEDLTRQFDLPLGTARLLLAQRDAAAALAVLDPYRRKTEAEGWGEERLRTTILQSLAHHALGDDDAALLALSDALELAEPGGLIRTFVDEGLPMAQLLSTAAARRIRPGYVAKLVAAFEADGDAREVPPAPRTSQPLVEPLSERELEVLRLIDQGLSNSQISERLFLALSTVKGHNRNIFGKLQVQRRTEAIARARELRLL